MTREAIACFWFPFLSGAGIASVTTAIACGRLRRASRLIDRLLLDDPAPVVRRRHAPPCHVRLLREEERP